MINCPNCGEEVDTEWMDECPLCEHEINDVEVGVSE